MHFLAASMYVICRKRSPRLSGSCSSGAIFFTLWNGWIINYGSLALTFYVAAALQIVLTVPIWLGLLLWGQLTLPVPGHCPR